MLLLPLPYFVKTMQSVTLIPFAMRTSKSSARPKFAYTKFLPCFQKINEFVNRFKMKQIHMLSRSYHFHFNLKCQKNVSGLIIFSLFENSAKCRSFKRPRPVKRRGALDSRVRISWSRGKPLHESQT